MRNILNMTQAELEIELANKAKANLENSISLLGMLSKVCNNIVIKGMEEDKINVCLNQFDDDVTKLIVGGDTLEDKWNLLQIIYVIIIDTMLVSTQKFNSLTSIMTVVVKKLKTLYLASLYQDRFEMKAKTLIEARKKVGWSQDRISSMMAQQATKNNLVSGLNVEDLTYTVYIALNTLTSSGYFVWVATGVTKRTLDLVPEVKEALGHIKNRVVDETTAERAMIEEPLPYNDKGVGGFHTDFMQKLNPVYSSRTGMPLKTPDALDRYINCINYIQKTQFTLNKPILKLLQKLLGNPDDVIKYQHIFFPVAKYVEITKDMLVGDKKRYKQDNDTATRLIATFYYLLREANIYEDVDTLWFTWFIDYRGRFYPRAGLLSPQGNKVSKALLQFKQGSRLLSPRHVNLFKMEVVKMFGFDKLPMDERLAKFSELEPYVLNIAKAVLDCEYPPHGDLWGGRAESFQCLAYCVEWYNIHKNPIGALVHLPVTIDGTCNGLQHISALLRDRDLGASVNLTPSDKPSDIYTDATVIAKRHLINLDAEKYATEYLSKRALSELKKKVALQNKTKGGKDKTSPPKTSDIKLKKKDIKETTLLVEEVKKFWLRQNISRKLAKTAVMTIPYSSTAQTQREYILQELSKSGFPIPKDETGKELVIYKAVLIDMIMKGVGEATLSANQLQKYLKGYLQEMKTQYCDLFNLFYTPFGLAIQSPVSLTAKMKKITVSNKIFRLKTFNHGGDEKTANLDKLAFGCSPNIIHSYDSCHLIMTVEQFEFENGDQNIWLVHDSYGCSPAYMDSLAFNTRDCFVKLHEQYPLSVCLANPYKLLPTTDSLDLNEVRKSTYFFH